MTTDHQADPTPTASDAASVETVRKVYAKDLREKDQVHTVFRVSQKSRVTARSGKVFLSLVLTDKSGEIDARVFDKVEALEPVFAAGDYVLAKGHTISFHGKTQVVIEALEKLDPEPLDPKEFEPPAPAAKEEPAPKSEARPAEAKADEASAPKRDEAPQRTGEGPGGARAVGQIRELVSERVSDPNVKALLLAFLDDAQISAALPHAHAVKGVHHAYRGGLAEHLLSVLRLTLRVADHYPMADRDLLLAGALLHDVMRVGESSQDKGGEPSDEGRLVGHLVMTAQKIREKTLGIPHFPPLLEQHLTHLVIAQNTSPEGGTVRSPVTLEAQIIQTLSSLDARIASWVDAMQRDPHERWTENLKLYNRSLWKGPAPTSRGRAPVEGGGRRKKDKDKKPPRERAEKPTGGGESAPATERPERAERPERTERTERQDKPREPRPPREPREPRPPREAKEGREPREQREPREPRPPRDPVNVPKELTFKPFSVLTKTEPAKPEGGSDSEG